MPLGDSITEGSDYFHCYRQELWILAKQSGLPIRFVGSRRNERFGGLPHEGYSGKPVEFLAERIGELYGRNPADIVLLHAGHNHFVEELPVSGILLSTASIVEQIRQVNPRAVFLIARVITVGKLPKYSYIPELNRGIASLAADLDRPESPVRVVDHTVGWDWQTDTIDDLVHPNEAGAAKMARHWFDALRRLLIKD